MSMLGLNATGWMSQGLSETFVCADTSLNGVFGGPPLWHNAAAEKDKFACCSYNQFLEWRDAYVLYNASRIHAKMSKDSYTYFVMRNVLICASCRCCCVSQTARASYYVKILAFCKIIHNSLSLIGDIRILPSTVIRFLHFLQRNSDLTGILR